jgi:flagellar basal body-associated protein FliL
MLEGFLNWVGVSGLLALLGLGTAYGKLQQEMAQVKKIAEDAHQAATQLLENREAISNLSVRFEERTAGLLRELKELKEIVRDQTRPPR